MPEKPVNKDKWNKKEDANNVVYILFGFEILGEII